jgi:hypothetical protein
MSKEKILIAGAILLLSASGAVAQMRPGARAVLQPFSASARCRLPVRFS